MAMYGKIFFTSLRILLNIFIRLTKCNSFSEAVSNNQHFQKPTRHDFQAQIREALRTAKERQRHRSRGLHNQIGSRIRQQEFWSDERPEETEQTNE